MNMPKNVVKNSINGKDTYMEDHERDGYYHIDEYDIVEKTAADDSAEDYESDGYYPHGNDGAEW